LGLGLGLGLGLWSGLGFFLGAPALCLSYGESFGERQLPVHV
jgi:hypothetical protein